MATFAIGDLQGCLHELQALLERIAFDAASDRLWFVGDLVNRGPRSLEVLRFVKSLHDRALVVLGNHDLHLLAVASGTDKTKKRDTLDDILAAPDRDELLEWLREQPLLVHDSASGIAMVHAGLPPQWSVARAAQAAREVEAAIRGPNRHGFFEHMYGNKPDRWSEALEGYERLRFITNALTRIRYCDRQGRLDLKAKQPPGMQPNSLTPWFEIADRESRDTRIVFGHWATLQTKHALDLKHNVRHVDTGCVWGGALTALRLEDDAVFQVKSQQPLTK